MAYREVRDADIGEILRRWQGGDSQRQIAAATGVSRNTVAKYIELAEGAGIGRDQRGGWRAEQGVDDMP